MEELLRVAFVLVVLLLLVAFLLLAVLRVAVASMPPVRLADQHLLAFALWLPVLTLVVAMSWLLALARLLRARVRSQKPPAKVEAEALESLNRFVEAPQQELDQLAATLADRKPVNLEESQFGSEKCRIKPSDALKRSDD